MVDLGASAVAANGTSNHKMGIKQSKATPSLKRHFTDSGAANTFAVVMMYYLFSKGE